MNSLYLGYMGMVIGHTVILGPDARPSRSLWRITTVGLLLNEILEHLSRSILSPIHCLMCRREADKKNESLARTPRRLVAWPRLLHGDDIWVQPAIWGREE